MQDFEAKVVGKVCFTRDGVIIPISPMDFIMLERALKQYKQTGPVGAATLHLEGTHVAVCVVPKEEGGDEG